MNKTEMMTRFKDNLSRIKQEIATTLHKMGANPDAVKIIGVTKTHPVEEIEAAIEAGLHCIAENKVQEAENKLPFIRAHYEEFHYIGHLQSNKIKKLMELKPALIHSIDSLTTAERLNKHLAENGTKQSILVQVNCSGEESKYGLADDFETIKSFMAHILQLPQLQVKGLMTMAPFTEDENKIRRSFRHLREHFDKINEMNLTPGKLETLSMGMSNDYLIAIEEGSNMVRIGSAIFA